MTNLDQQEFWTRSAGPTWVSHQAEMDALLTPVLDLTMEAAALQPGERVLDIGCGTGHSTEVVAAAVGTSGHVSGLDISETMLALATDRTASLPQVSLLCADAQTHALPPHSFDVLFSRFGVMFFEDTTAAFANLWSALAPGGRMALAAWGPVADNPWFMDPAHAARQVLGPSPKVDRTLPGPFAFENPDRILPQLTAAGISDPTVSTHDILLTPRGSVPEVARLCCQIGPADSALSYHNGDDAARIAVAGAVAGRMAKYDTTDGVRVPARIHIYSARKPS
ncbi:MAG: methyltransferase domain-containing protein [Pseudomonadota bacterium]